jgi:hypothetical protein
MPGSSRVGISPAGLLHTAEWGRRGLRPRAVGRQGQPRLAGPWGQGRSRAGPRRADGWSRRVAGHGRRSRSGQAGAVARREPELRMVPTPPRDTAELGDAWQPGLLPSSRVGPTPVYPPPQEEEAAAERRALFAASASGALGGEAAVGGGCIRARRRARGRDFFFSEDSARLG